MTDREIFNETIKEVTSYVKNLLKTKGTEYATKDNPFHNFDRVAAARNQTPQQALLGMLYKHWISIQDIVDFDQDVEIETVHEKIGDAISYLTILLALYERQNTKQP